MLCGSFWLLLWPCDQSPCILTVLSEASFSRLLGSVRLFAPKTVRQPYLPGRSFKPSYAWGLTNAYLTLQLVYNFFLGSIWYRQCSASEFFLNSFIYLVSNHGLLGMLTIQMLTELRVKITLWSSQGSTGSKEMGLVLLNSCVSGC